MERKIPRERPSSAIAYRVGFPISTHPLEGMRFTLQLVVCQVEEHRFLILP